MPIRYFLGPTPNMNSALAINEVIFGNFFNQVQNDKRNKVIVMLPEGDSATHPSLNAFQEKTYEEMLIEKQKPEWQGEIFKGE